MPQTFLAIDLGAESGRLIRATLDGGKISMAEIHRFRTQGLLMHGVRQWDIARIYEEIVVGLTKAAAIEGDPPAGIGIDTWGVDFGFIAADGSLVGNPVHYRDNRTNGMIEAAGAVVAQADIYARTGVMTLPFNSLYQLLAMVKADAPALKIADKLLFIGPLLGYLLTGKAMAEYTIASTGQMLDAKTGDWDAELLGKLGIPVNFLPPITAPGTIVGPLLTDITRETGLDPRTPFISAAVHDTACAVAAVPVDPKIGDDWAYLSSGTWSLIGAELKQPAISPATMEARFTNEGGVENTYRFLKNIFGLWLVQECRRAWVGEAGGIDKGLDYAALTAEADAAEPFRSVIGLDDERLFAPDHMPNTVSEICLERRLPLPAKRGEFIRCCLESLALSYRRSLSDMDALLGRKTKVLYVVGGGVQNKLLCQLTADACGIEVHAGPVEATALGNVLVQALAVGAFASLADGRAAIRASHKITYYRPRPSDRWAALQKQIYGR